MTSHAGKLLVAKPALEDPNFRRTVVYLIDHHDDGAFGVILNRPSKLDVSLHFELPPGAVNPPSVFFEGGPVDRDSVIALGSHDAGPVEVVDLDRVLAGEPPSHTQLRFFVGYAGWAGGQLEGELAGDAWFVLEPQRAPTIIDDLFGAHPDELWRTVLRRQGGALGKLAFYPDDLMAN